VLAVLAGANACSDSQQSAPQSDASPSGDAPATPVPEASTGDDDATAPQDAGAPDASPSDGGRDLSTDRSRFFGDSRCANSGFLLCEDFESPPLDKATWSTAGKAPVVDTAEHARGAHALHVTMNGKGMSAISEKRTFPAPKDAYFGRMFVKFKTLPLPPAMTYAHWTILAASGTAVPGEIRVGGQLQSGKNLFGVGTDNRTDGGTGDWTNSDHDPDGGPRAVPTDEWMCIEWRHDGSANETQFWWDGVPHPSLSTTETTHGGEKVPYVLPQFTSVWFGWAEYQDSGVPFDLWIDEIAIDVERIGCVL